MAIREGKTKKVEPFLAASIRSKNDVTAGNGLRHDIIPGKAAVANETTVNLFELLKASGIPVAYIARESDTSFIAFDCEMIPIEVVVRAKAYGSALKRDPSLTEGDAFPELVVEFFLKTSDKTWNGHTLPVDDPYMVIEGANLSLYDPAKPVSAESRILTVPLDEVFEPWMLVRFEEMAIIATQAFVVIQHAFSLYDHDCVDFKIEFGMNTYAGLLIADVIDGDSCRLIYQGEHQDKERYRKGGTPEDLLAHYQHIAELTARFKHHYEQVAAAQRTHGGRYKTAFTDM